MSSFNNRRKAFTLVEISIVFVILGLLVGGVLAGQSLIRAAELKSISTEFSNYKTVLNAFQDKYLSLPGDIPNAVQFWGAQAGGTTDGWDTTCNDLTTAATGTATCNGNGDIKIAGNPSKYAENFRAWQHLANAGLVSGSFSGISGPLGYDAVIGTNVPKSKAGSGAGWSIGWFQPFPPGTNDDDYFDGAYGNMLLFGGNSGIYTGNPVISAQEAYAVDTKLDDRKPGTGTIVTVKRPQCVTPTYDAYKLTDTSQGCNLYFYSGF